MIEDVREWTGCHCPKCGNKCKVQQETFTAGEVGMYCKKCKTAYIICAIHPEWVTVR